MTTTLYYFSGTGNSLKVARDLAAELGDANLVPIARAISQPVDVPGERVGIVFPVYIWGLPLIVAEFIKRLPPSPSSYFFAVATYGGSPAGTMGQAAELFKSKGMTLSAGFTVQMPGNYTPLYGAVAPKKQLAMFAKEKEKVKVIAEVVRRKKTRGMEQSFFLVNWIFSGIIYKHAAPHIYDMDKGFWADEKCNGCGICAKVCPVHNITLAQGKPQWHHRCEQCLACLQWCPAEAIQSGKKTAGRKRYRHPETSIEDFTVTRK